MNGWWALGTTLIGLGGCGAKPPTAVSSATAATTTSQETYRYCAGTVTEWEEHRCIWELTPEQQRRRSYSQRLTLRGGKVVRFETITGSGALYRNEESASYRYENGRIRGLTRSNWNGVVTGSGDVSPDGLRLFYFDHLGRPRPDMTPRDKWVGKTSGLVRQLDERGRVLESRYTDHRGNPQPELGAHAVRVKRDGRGALLELSYFGKDGEPVKGGKLDVHRIAYTNDARGIATDERYFDVSGQPMLHKGAHLVRTQLNDVGEAVAYAYFDAAGRTVRSDAYGAASVRKTRDARGNEVVTELFDEQGKPTLGAESYATLRRVFDAQDLVIEWSNFGVRDEPVRDKSGYATVRQRRNARGNVVLESTLDEKGAPALNADGNHLVEIGYDERDNPISYRYLGLDQRPVVVKQGYASKRLRYDGDRLIGIAYFDAAGQAANVPAGYATTEFHYGDDGNESARLYFDVNRKPVRLCQGKIGEPLKAEIRDRAAGSRACYDDLLRDRPVARGKLLLELQLSLTGEVVDAAISSDEMQDSGFSECVLSLFRPTFRSAPEDGCANVRLPLVFTPKAPETSAQ